MAKPANPSFRDTALNRMIELENVAARRGLVSRLQRYYDNYLYYTGLNLPPENTDQPLGINYVAPIVEKHASYLWGQWDDQRDIVLFQVDPVVEDDDETPTEAAKALARRIQRYAQRLLRRNNGNVMLYEASLNAGIYGDTFLKAYWDPLEARVKVESVLPEYVHCRWDPQDLTKVIEVIVSYPIERAEAYEKYGTYGNPMIDRAGAVPLLWHGFAVYWERWTADRFEIWIDDVSVKQLPNPYVRLSKSSGQFLPGIIPFVHIPNVRVGGEFYGFDDAGRSQKLQDEINRAYADQSDIINNHAHPVTIVNRYFGDVNSLPIGPDVVWDLGREGEAKYLQWEGTPPQVLDYLDRVREIMFDTASMTDVAFGRHQGTQQSGMALSIEMLPVTERARWKRILWDIGLRELVQKAVFIETASNQDADLGFTYDDTLVHEIHPKFAPILPRDRAAIVNEQIGLNVNDLRSLEMALQALGVEDVEGEVARIHEQMELRAKLGIKPGGQGGYGMGPGQSQDSVTPAARGRPPKGK